MDAFLNSIFDGGTSESVVAFGPTCARLLLAGALGGCVALCQAFCTRNRARTPGLSGALVLLSMLIAMVTLAIGNNAAKAFTLVGTLAIVRFRTPVHDIRDTAFVIFAVATGIAIGAFNPMIAAAGVLVVGGVAMLLSARRSSDDTETLLLGAGRLEVRFAGDGSQDEVERLLREHAKVFRLLMTRHGEGGMRLLYAVDLDRARSSALVHAAQAIPGARRAALSFGVPVDEES
jgi:hypothetical protein